MSWLGQVRVCGAGPHLPIQGYIGYPPRIPQGYIEQPRETALIVINQPRNLTGFSKESSREWEFYKIEIYHNKTKHFFLSVCIFQVAFCTVAKISWHQLTFNAFIHVTLVRTTFDIFSPATTRLVITRLVQTGLYGVMFRVTQLLRFPFRQYWPFS